MRTSSTILAAAALTAALSTLGLAAGPAFAGSQGIEVPHQDLNLRNEAGRATLDRRIAYAARQLCGVYHTTELNWRQMSENCQDEVIAATKVQRDALIGGERYASIRVNLATN